MPMLQKKDYLKFTKCSKICHACGKPLQESQRHLSVLKKEDGAPTEEEVAVSETRAKDETAEGEQDLTRLDYCPKCWGEIKERAYLAFWLGKQGPENNNQPKKLTRKERNMALSALLDTLQDRSSGDDQDYRAHVFFLAHLLMKFRLLKWDSTVKSDQGVPSRIFFQRVGGEEMIEVEDMALSDETVVQVKEEIEAYLQKSTGQLVQF